MSEHDSRADLDPFDPRLFSRGTVDPNVPTEGPIKVELRGEQRIIRADFWPEFETAGWRYVGVPSPEELPDATIVRVPDDPRDLWPQSRILMASGQAGMWLTKEHLARESIDASANAVARYINRPAVPRENNRGGKTGEPSSLRSCDYLGFSYFGEGVVLLLEKVTVLQREVAALREAQEQTS